MIAPRRLDTAREAGREAGRHGDVREPALSPAFERLLAHDPDLRLGDGDALGRAWTEGYDAEAP